MTQAMNQNRQTRTIKRTICIGLGGTGRDVLMRIRRFIIDKYGKLGELPVISFVQIDTDKGSLNTSGLPTGNTYHGEVILFSDAEKVITKMTSQAVNDLVHEIEHKSLFKSPYFHIESWLDPRLKNQVKSIEDGAQGIRPIGRLAFFHNYLQIQKAIEAAEARTRGHEAFLLKKGFDVQAGLDIFVVGSLCGGTGSGMFLDLAYSLRNLYKNKIEIKTCGYLVISPNLYGNLSSMNANTYAALKELNYYTNNNSIFEACYDPQNQINVIEKRPPFDFTYLVSNQTLGDYEVRDKGKLCNIIAYKIFLDFSSEISSLIKSHRDNFLDPTVMLGLDDPPFKMSQYYLTFGLSVIYFTRDRFVQIALNRLTFKLIQFWLEGVGQSPESQDLLERFLLKWTADRNAKDCFTSKLKEATQENNRNFSQSLSKWRASLQESECKNSDDIEKLKQDLPRAFKSEFRKVQAGETESSRGIWLTSLQRVQPSLAEKFKNDIDMFLEELLNPDNSNFSINSSLTFLEALRTQINQYQRLFEERKQELKGMYPSEKIDKMWTDVKQEIEDLEQKPKLRIPFMKNKPNSKIQEVILNAIQNGSQLIQHNFDVAVSEEALKIVEVLQKHISNRLNQVQAFSSLVQNLKIFYQKQEDELRQLNFDEMSGEAIFPEDDIEQCIPNNGSSTQLASISHKITEELGLGISLFTFLKTVVIDEKQLQTKTDLTIESLFGSVSLNQMQSVIKRFMNSYAIADRVQRLEQILQSSKPLLPLSLTSPRFNNNDKKNNQLIGFKQTDELEAKQFKHILKHDLGIADTCFASIQAEDEIVIVTQYAGFPLRIINSLYQMRESYKIHQENSILHNNYKIIFPDIIPIDAKTIEELEYVFYPCLACEAIQYNKHTNNYELPCKDNLFNTDYTVSLNPNWREALEQIASRKDLTDIIHNLYHQIMTNINNNPQLWQDYYRPKILQFSIFVKSFTEENINFSYKSKVIGQEATDTTPAKEGIITRFIAQIKDMIEPKVPPVLPNQPYQSLTQTNINQQLLSEEVIETTIEES